MWSESRIKLFGGLVNLPDGFRPVTGIGHERAKELELQQQVLPIGARAEKKRIGLRVETQAQRFAGENALQVVHGVFAEPAGGEGKIGQKRKSRLVEWHAERAAADADGDTDAARFKIGLFQVEADAVFKLEQRAAKIIDQLFFYNLTRRAEVGVGKLRLFGFRLSCDSHRVTGVISGNYSLGGRGGFETSTDENLATVRFAPGGSQRRSAVLRGDFGESRFVQSEVG